MNFKDHSNNVYLYSITWFSEKKKCDSFMYCGTWEQILEHCKITDCLSERRVAKDTLDDLELDVIADGEKALLSYSHNGTKHLKAVSECKKSFCDAFKRRIEAVEKGEI